MNQPREWQKNALQIWEKNQKGVISVVTGGGKTFFAILCIMEFFKKYPHGQILIIIPTIALMDQWYVSIIEEIQLNVDEISIFSGYEKSKQLNKVNLIIINTARNFQYQSPNEKMLIVDECHRSGSALNSLSLIKGCEAYLGLSATPIRQYDDGFNLYIKPILGDVIFTYSYLDALKDNVICPFELINIKFDLLSNESKQYDFLTKKVAVLYKKYQEGLSVESEIRILLQKRAQISSSAKMRIPITAKLVENEINQRIVIFFERIDQVDILYENLLKRNFSVTKYHSKMSPILRRENLRLYKTSVYNILVTCKSLDEGLNVPDTTVAIIASSTMSLRQRIQRIGRVLRPYPGKENAKIYTLYATKSEENYLKKFDTEINSINEIFWLKGGIKTIG